MPGTINRALFVLQQAAPSQEIEVHCSSSIDFLSTIHMDEDLARQVADGSQRLDMLLAQHIREQVQLMSLDDICQMMRAHRIDTVHDANLGLDLIRAAESAAERLADVAFSEAPEAEIAGMWDWQADAGRACDASQNSRAEAVLDALCVLQIQASDVASAVLDPSDHMLTAQPHPKGLG